LRERLRERELLVLIWAAALVRWRTAARELLVLIWAAAQMRWLLLLAPLPRGRRRTRKSTPCTRPASTSSPAR
jgi:hypothetical protein